MVVHSGEKPHKCPCCNHQYARAATLQQHLKTHYDLNDQAQDTAMMGSNAIYQHVLYLPEVNGNAVIEEDGVEYQQIRYVEVKQELSYINEDEAVETIIDC